MRKEHPADDEWVEIMVDTLDDYWNQYKDSYGEDPSIPQYKELWKVEFLKKNYELIIRAIFRNTY